jgi:hypothetical protein
MEGELMGRTISIRGKAAGDFARAWKAAQREEPGTPAAPEEPPVRQRLINLVRRLAEMDCPRATHEEYEELCEFAELSNELQMESALGADTSEGFIITALHTLGRTTEAAKEWLKKYDKPKPKKKTFARRPAKVTLPPTGNRLYKRKKRKEKTK